MILIFISLQGFSQPYFACFTPSDTAGCIPFTVTLNDCSSPNGGFPQYYIDGNTSLVTSDTNFIFTTPGLHTITQYVNGDAGLLFFTDSFFIHPVPIPIAEISYCDGNVVQLSINDNNYDFFSIVWESGNPPSNINNGTFNHSYSNSSVKTIMLSGRYNDAFCGADTNIVVQPINDILKPQVNSLTVHSNDTLSMNFLTQNNVSYKIRKNSVEISDFLSTTNNTTISIPSTNLNTNNFCFEVEAYDKCGLSILSDVICTTNLSIASLNNENSISISSYTGPLFSKMSLTKIGGNTFDFTTNQPIIFLDSLIICGVEYCYFLTTELSNGATSISDTFCITASSTDLPPTLKLHSTFLNDGNLKLSWNKPASNVKNYYIYQNNSLLTSLKTEQYVFNPLNDACFYIDYEDTCSLKSEKSKINCPIYLKVLKNQLSTYDLQWNEYKTASVKNYKYVVYDENINEIKFDSTMNFTAQFVEQNLENQTLFFRVFGIDSLGNEFTQSNLVQLDAINAVLIPNIFSPNDDGMNDTFGPIIKFISEINFQIYNNWGEQLFQTQTIGEKWDGTLNGNPVPEGVYSYSIVGKDKLGNSFEKIGTITLIR